MVVADTYYIMSDIYGIIVKDSFISYLTGTEVTGHIDNIPAIKHLCDNRGIWLHAKG